MWFHGGWSFGVTASTDNRNFTFPRALVGICSFPCYRAVNDDCYLHVTVPLAGSIECLATIVTLHVTGHLVTIETAVLHVTEQSVTTIILHLTEPSMTIAILCVTVSDDCNLTCHRAFSDDRNFTRYSQWRSQSYMLQSSQWRSQFFML